MGHIGNLMKKIISFIALKIKKISSNIKKNNGSILNFGIEYFLYQFIFKSHYINIITLIVLDSILTQKITLTDFLNHDGDKGH